MTYEPSPGTIAFRVIEFLRERPAQRLMASAEIADALGIDPTSMSPCLDTAVKRGALRLVKNGRVNMYALGGDDPIEAPTPEAAPARSNPRRHFMAGLFTDGSMQIEIDAAVVSLTEFEVIKLRRLLGAAV